MAVIITRPRLKIAFSTGAAVVLPAPSGFNLLPTSSGILASWQPLPSTQYPVGGYWIWRKRSSESDSAFVRIGNTPSSSFLDSSVIGGTDYTYRVQGFDTFSPPTPGEFTSTLSVTALVITIGGGGGKLIHGDFRWVLANSSDLSRLGELTQGRSRTLTVGLNRPGSASVTLPLDYRLSDAAAVLETCLLVYYRDRIVWSGPVWTIEEAVPEDRVTLNAVGWFEILNHRYVRERLTWGASGTSPQKVDAGQIAQELVTHAAAGDLDIGAPFYISNGTTESTQGRIATAEPLSVIGNQIQQFSNVESGYDWHIDPLTRDFNIYRLKGQNLSDNIAFAYGTGVNNIQSFNRQIDGSQLTNKIYVTGKTGGINARDDESRLRFGTMESAESLSDESRVDTLNGYANAEIAYRKNPRQTFSLTPMAATGNARVPRLFVDYDVGDTIKFTARKGRIQVLDQRIRVFGASFTVDDQGIERVSNLQVTYEG
jgi:hypothetical protein